MSCNESLNYTIASENGQKGTWVPEQLDWIEIGFDSEEEMIPKFLSWMSLKLFMERRNSFIDGGLRLKKKENGPYSIVWAESDVC